MVGASPRTRECDHEARNTTIKHTRKRKTHIAAVFLHLLAPVTRTRMHTHSRMHHSTCTRAHKHTRKHADTHTHARAHQCNIFCLYPPDRNTAPSPALGHYVAQRSLAHHQCILNQLHRNMNSTRKMRHRRRFKKRTAPPQRAGVDLTLCKRRDHSNARLIRASFRSRIPPTGRCSGTRPKKRVHNHARKTRQQK